MWSLAIPEKTTRSDEHKFILDSREKLPDLLFHTVSVSSQFLNGIWIEQEITCFRSLVGILIDLKCHTIFALTSTFQIGIFAGLLI